MLRVEKKERTYHFLRTWVKLAKRHSATLSWDWETIDRYLEQQVYPRGEQWPVLCHNDMQELNFLIPANTDPAESAALNASECECVRLIDYEYACLGHPAFDMANHFLERCLDNLTMDVNRDAFPSASERTAFYRSYVQQWKAMGHELPHRMDGKSWDHEVHVLLGASHIQWACWGILKDQNVYADIRMTWFHDWLANADFMRDTVKLSPVR
jgi:thiamine kinase-like enzyme